MTKKYIVKYIDTDTVEVIVDTKKDFNLWLKQHNKIRKEDGECKEHSSEFELEEIDYYNNK